MSANLKVIKFFIKNSPVGEVSDVLEDITTIAGQDFLANTEIRQQLQEYYEQHRQHVTLDNGQTVTITPQGRQESMPKQQQTNEYGQEDDQQQEY